MNDAFLVRGVEGFSNLKGKFEGSSARAVAKIDVPRGAVLDPLNQSRSTVSTGVADAKQWERGNRYEGVGLIREGTGKRRR